MGMRSLASAGKAFLLLVTLSIQPAHAISLYGTTDIHDPSTIVRDGDRYWTFGTGIGANLPINALYSTDLVNWKRGPSPVPPNTYPNWIKSKVPGFFGHFWAPDIIQMNGRYYLYYSAFSASSGMHSAIGVMVTDSLNNPNWQDLGMIVSTFDDPRSSQGQPVNTIDAGLFRDANNRVWMVYGSHYAGIYVREINPNTGRLMNSNRYPVVGNNGGWHEFEGAQVQYINGYYYMFVNLGDCCAGKDSNYYIVAGRSTSPTGPYVDRNGRDLWNYGGTTVLSTQGNYIGPGHFGYLNNGGQDLATIHYYDGASPTGWPARLDMLELSFPGGWPAFNRNFQLGEPSDHKPQPDPTFVTDGRVTFTSSHSGKVMEVENGSIENGANIVQWVNNGGANQQWDITHLGDGWYSIINAFSGKAVDVYNMSTDDGGEIRQWEDWGGDGQQWRFVDEGNGNYGILSRLNGKALDVYEFSTADGGDIRQWAYWAGAPQLWQLSYVGANTQSESQSLTVQEGSGFCSVDGSIDTNHSGYSGGGFANTDNANGNGINWSVNVPQAGTYTLSWRFANGASNRPGSVIANGDSQASIDFAGTGNWASWSNSGSVTVNLNAGANTIRLQATGSAGLPNVDSLSITGIAPSANICN